MESSFYSLDQTIVQFLSLSFFYSLAIGGLFSLVKLIAQASPSPYTLKAFGIICLPGIFYCFLESVSQHKAWNFVTVLFYLTLLALVQMLLIRRIPFKQYFLLSCFLALILWMTIPKALMKLF